MEKNFLQKKFQLFDNKLFDTTITMQSTISNFFICRKLYPCTSTSLPRFVNEAILRMVLYMAMIHYDYVK